MVRILTGTGMLSILIDDPYRTIIIETPENGAVSPVQDVQLSGNATYIFRPATRL
jgi:hypothetical protein